MMWYRITNAWGSPAMESINYCLGIAWSQWLGPHFYTVLRSVLIILLTTFITHECCQITGNYLRSWAWLHSPATWHYLHVETAVLVILSYLRKDCTVVSHQNFIQNWHHNRAININLFSFRGKYSIKCECFCCCWHRSGVTNVMFNNNFPFGWLAFDHRWRAFFDFFWITRSIKQKQTL